MQPRFPLVALAATFIFAIGGCGKDASKAAATDAEMQARAKAAADAMLAADSAKFREAALGLNAKPAADPVQAPPVTADNSAVKDSGAATAPPPPPPIAAPSAPATPEQASGFDDSPEGVEAKRLLKTYIDRLKDPESVRFRDLRSVNFREGNGKFAFGVCGEVNAKNSFGAYVGYRHFIVWKSANGEVNVGTQSNDEFDNLFWHSFAKLADCLPR